MISLTIVPSAARSAQAIDLWWHDHTGRPTLFRDEFTAALARLLSTPFLGAPYPDPRTPGVRRLLLPKTQHHIYYRYEPAQHEITILQVWSTRRRNTPRLR